MSEWEIDKETAEYLTVKLTESLNNDPVYLKQQLQTAKEENEKLEIKYNEVFNIGKRNTRMLAHIREKLNLGLERQGELPEIIEELTQQNKQMSEDIMLKDKMIELLAANGSCKGILCKANLSDVYNGSPVCTECRKSHYKTIAQQALNQAKEDKENEHKF